MNVGETLRFILLVFLSLPIRKRYIGLGISVTDIIRIQIVQPLVNVKVAHLVNFVGKVFVTKTASPIGGTMKWMSRIDQYTSTLTNI